MLAIAVSAPQAVASGELSLQPTSLYFGSVWIGRTRTISVTLKNVGSSSVTLSGETLLGTGYSVSGVLVPKTLTAGASTTFNVNFPPMKTGGVTGQLQLLSNATNSRYSIPLYGTGVASSLEGYASATPTSAAFGDVPVGTRNTQSVTLKNTGTAGISISSVTVAGSGFSASGISTPVSVAAGGTVQLTVAFQPAATETFSGSLVIGSTASNSSLTIALSGTGVTSTRTLNVTPTSVSFGNVGVNSTDTQKITLQNSGNSSLTISGDSVLGAGMSATGLSGGITLAPGQAATVTVEFAPKATGSVTGAISITSNASNGATYTVTLTGTGIATHVVALQWQASSSSGVIGYHVYRSTVSGGSYSKLTSSTINSTSYSDSSVTSGTQYYYAVTAVTADGAESGYSNQVTVYVP